VFFLSIFTALIKVQGAKPADKGNKKPDSAGKPKEKLDKPRETSAGGVCTKNNGTSGKFTVRNCAKPEDDQMIILFDALYERDANFSKVGKSGKLKHSLENFATLEFLFTPMDNLIMYQVYK